MRFHELTRRTWLRSTLAASACGLAASYLPTPITARSEQPDCANSDDNSIPTDLDIIDCHTHFYDPSRPEGVPWPGPGTSIYRTVLPSHLRETKSFRPVTGTVIVEASGWIEDNAWLLNLAKDDPFVLGIVGHVDPGTPEFPQQIERFARNPLFRGIRVSVDLLQRLLDNNALRDLQRLAELNLTLDVNGGPDTPAVLAQAAPRLPKLRIVLNHIGNVHVTDQPPPRAWSDAIQAASRHANVSCKISAFVESAARGGRKPSSELDFYRPYLDVVWNAFESERVIYGSNWPVSDLATDYATLQRLALTYAAEKGDAALRRFCADNSQTAYQWVERSGRNKPR